MELSVALVVFLLKTGIKRLDKDYSIYSFIEDVLSAFGEKTGKKLSDIIKKSHYEINNILKDQNLSKLGVDTTRTSMVRANVLDILKQVKISNTMLTDHNCNAEEITQFIITKYANSANISDDIELHDMKLVLYEIIKVHIDIATQDRAFITKILFDIYEYSQMNPAILKKVTKTESNTDLLLKGQAILFKMMKQQYSSSKATQNGEPDHWAPNISEMSQSMDPEDDAFLDFIKGGQGNVTLA